MKLEHFLTPETYNFLLGRVKHQPSQTSSLITIKLKLRKGKYALKLPKMRT